MQSGLAEIQSPYKIKEITFGRLYPGYIYRREIVDDSDHGGDGKLPMVNCYSDDTGHWIGDPRMARYLTNKLGLRQIQKARRSHCAASVGFNESEQKWYGWSHRCICGFGVGDKIFKERFGDDETLFTQHGDKPILNMADAKKAAKLFAAYVS